MNNLKTAIKFLYSALSDSFQQIDIEEILQWLYDKRKAVQVDVQQIPLLQMDKWTYNETEGRIQHQSGKFFSIDGIRVSTNYGLKGTWDQPIINQPEIGFLGILTQMKTASYTFCYKPK